MGHNPVADLHGHQQVNAVAAHRTACIDVLDVDLQFPSQSASQGTAHDIIGLTERLHSSQPRSQRLLAIARHATSAPRAGGGGNGNILLPQVREAGILKVEGSLQLFRLHEAPDRQSSTTLGPIQPEWISGWNQDWLKN